MPTISDVSIIDSNTAQAKPVESGLERTICSPELCGSKNLTVYQANDPRRPAARGRCAARTITSFTSCKDPPTVACSSTVESHAAEEGAGVLLVPGESARFEAARSDLELLHMVTPKPPAGVEAGLPGGPGYFFNRQEAARTERCERRPRAPILRRVEREAARRQPADADQRDPGRRDALQRGRRIALSHAQGHRREPRRRRVTST